MNSNWKTLESEIQLKEISDISKTKPVIIYKHSTRCPISYGVNAELQNNWDIPESAATFYYLDLIKYRNVSDKVAQIFNVLHQSPQLIIIKNGEAVKSESHWSINSAKIKKALQEYK